VFGTIMLRIALGQGAFFAGGGLRQLLASGDEAKLIFFADTLAAPWFIVIVIYGVFVPNPWQRGAAVGGGVARLWRVRLGGFALAWGAVAVRLGVGCLTKRALRMAFAVAVAVYGSHRIERLRREAVEARQLGQYVLTRRLGKGG